MEDERLEDHYEAMKPEARKLAIEMARKGLMAVSRFDGHEYCWFDLRPGRKGPEGVTIQGTRTLRKLDYELLGVAQDIGLVGILPIEGNEVRLPTVAAWAEAGLAFDPSRPHAPADWKRTHGDWRRERWTSNARQDEVRIVPRKDMKPFFHVVEDRGYRDGNLGYRLGDVAIEGGAASNTIAVWRPGSPVEFWYAYSCSLDPFTGGDYADIDALVADLHADGRFVSDLRLTSAYLTDDEEVVAKLHEGMVLEQISNDWFMMLPRVDGRHGELVAVDRAIVTRLFAGERLTSLGHIPFRHGFRQWGEKKSFALTGSALAAAAPKPASRPAMKAKRDRSKILARDDKGRPITVNDINRESYLPRLKDGPIEVLPPFDYPGGEEQWEIDQLVEQVKLRRRASS